MSFGAVYFLDGHTKATKKEQLQLYKYKYKLKVQN